LSRHELTFSDLTKVMTERAHAGVGTVPPTSLANALSALHQFLSERGQSENAVVGGFLRVTYFRERRAHLEALRNAGRSSAYIKNRKSLLRHWHLLVLELDRAEAAAQHTEAPFQQALNELFSQGTSGISVAKAIGISKATLARWRHGGIPRVGSLRKVQALERHFAQAPGTLIDLLAHPMGAPTGRGDVDRGPAEISYRTRLRKQCKDEYALKDPDDRLRQEWRGLLRYKTSLDGDGLKRGGRSRWSYTLEPVRPENQLHWFALVGRAPSPGYCASAAMYWGLATRFLGWAVLSEDDGGPEVSGPERGSLLLLSDPRLVGLYLSWRVDRSDGQQNNGALVFLQFVSMLCHPTTGYLTQSREQFLWHAEASSPEGWTSRCQRAFDHAKQLIRTIKNGLETSRDPREPIAHILSLPNPLGAVVDAIKRMDAARPTTGGKSEAIWARDRLSVKLLASNPLRAKNLILLRIAPDAKGRPAHLRKVDGVWRIRIERREFKNADGAARDRAYDMPVREEVWPDLERYLRDYRPLLADASNPYLLASGKKSNAPMYSFNRRFEALTARYFPGCPGVGPHAMRYVVATTILKMKPGSWMAAAWALHDQEATVRKHYAHLDSQDAARWLDDVMTSALSGV
jgi:hypothetical protein